MTDYAPRELSDCVHRALNQMPVVILSGLRQTGKSTLLRLLQNSEIGRKKAQKSQKADNFPSPLCLLRLFAAILQAALLLRDPHFRSSHGAAGPQPNPGD